MAGGRAVTEIIGGNFGGGDGSGSLIIVDKTGTAIATFNGDTGVLTLASGTGLNLLLDGVKLTLGTDSDIAAVLRATVLNANTALTGVVVGTPVTPAVAANSLIVGNITADGDMMLVTQTGGNSHAFLWYDTSAKILRLYSGDGVEVAKFDAAATTITGTLGVTGKTTLTGGLNLGAAEAVTISGGVATVTKSFVSLAGEGATTDTLDSISKSGQAEGDILVLRCAGNYTITADNSATMLLGAGTRALAQGAVLILIATSATIWSELVFLTAAA